ncbi:MAG: tyrosine-type recombinase/integrase, partial [Hyphomicrobiales bacterium]|nr:tyrosine-type recombinase/integrase [Hyphomicrobiales bacterium]
MLENYFEATFTIQRLRTGLSGPYIDGFAEMLEKERYSFGIGRRYLRAAAHLGHYLETRGIGLDAVVFDVLEAFAQHLPSCCCPQSNGGTTEDVARGAKLFLKYLRVSRGLAIAELEKNKALVPELVQDFRHWLKNQRGLSESSLRTYGNGAAELIHSLGSDPDTYDAPSLRGFLIDHSRTVGPGKAKNLVNALRMFLRYLIHEGRCRAGLDRAIPALAGWRHAALPSYLSACEVRQTIEACDDGSVMGVRDKAIIVLLTRLGLRAGDVHALCLSKIDWEDGSFLVSGKTPQEVRLPLPQEVGDALVAYLKCRPRV